MEPKVIHFMQSLREICAFHSFCRTAHQIVPNQHFLKKTLNQQFFIYGDIQNIVENGIVAILCAFDFSCKPTIKWKWV